MKRKRYYVCVVLITLLFAAASFWMDEGEGIEGEGVARGSPGEGEKEISLYLEVPELGEEETYRLTIGERAYTQEEREELFLRGVAEIERGFAAEGEDTGHITKQVNLPETLQNGQIDVEWSVGEPEVIGFDGNIDQEYVEESGTMTTVCAKLSYRGYEYLYEFPVCVYPEAVEGMDAVKKELQEYFEEKELLGDKELALPQKMGGYKLKWETKKERTPLLILGLGVIALFAVHYSTYEADIKKRVRRRRELEREYPVMVSQFALLIGAGMTIKSVFERITEQYTRSLAQKKQKRNALYEEMLIVLRRISDGVGERKAYEEFGDRLELAPYRRFSMMLIQNLQKGSGGLGETLEKEADRAFEERKNQAKRKGEEAGTKLLLPMMLMLFVVIAIMLIPACMTMEMY